MPVWKRKRKGSLWGNCLSHNMLADIGLVHLKAVRQVAQSVAASLQKPGSVWSLWTTSSLVDINDKETACWPGHHKIGDQEESITHSHLHSYGHDIFSVTTTSDSDKSAINASYVHWHACNDVQDLHNCTLLLVQANWRAYATSAMTLTSWSGGVFIVEPHLSGKTLGAKPLQQNLVTLRGMVTWEWLVSSWQIPHSSHNTQIYVFSTLAVISLLLAGDTEASMALALNCW